MYRRLAVSVGHDLGGGVFQFKAERWETNTLLAVAGGEALLCDPNWEPDEIEAERAEAALLAGGATYLLITHADYDHVCGIGLFPGATVVAGEGTAEKIWSGAAAQGLRGASEEWGLEWPAEPRVDRVAAAGEELRLGAFRVKALEARGHVADGRAYVLLDQSILLPGDYLSTMTYPFVIDSIGRYRETNARLLAALDEHDVRLVVPGHGPALAPGEAHAVGEADNAYLAAVEQAAREAVAAGLAPSLALLHVYAVEPPRATTDDFEIYGLRVWNAKKALEEVRGG